MPSYSAGTGESTIFPLPNGSKTAGTIPVPCTSGEIRTALNFETARFKLAAVVRIMHGDVLKMRLLLMGTNGTG
jgi:hypothetical protein